MSHAAITGAHVRLVRAVGPPFCTVLRNSDGDHTPSLPARGKLRSHGQPTKKGAIT
jgi:hypothetical protein